MAITLGKKFDAGKWTGRLQLALQIIEGLMTLFGHRAHVHENNDEGFAVDTSEMSTRHAEVLASKADEALGPAYDVTAANGSLLVTLAGLPKKTGKK